MRNVSSVSEANYFKTRYENMPEVKRGEKYTIKKGESLWNIAKNNLGENAKNSEILDYTYQIAKLNNFDSIEKINNIKDNVEIYLPEQTSNNKVKPKPQTKPQAKKPQESKPTPTQTKVVKPEQKKPQTTQPVEDNPFLRFNPNMSTPFETTWKPTEEEIKVPLATAEQLKAQNTKPAQTKKPTPAQPAKKVTPKPAEKPKSNAVLGFEDKRNIILNTPQDKILVTCGYKSDTNQSFTIYEHHPKGYEPDKILATFETDINGNIINMGFNGRKDELEGYYDFIVDRNGQITQTNPITLEKKIVGSINKTDIDKIEKVLKSEITEYNKEHPAYFD